MYKDGSEKYHQFNNESFTANGSITSLPVAVIEDQSEEDSSVLSYSSTETTSASGSSLSPVSSYSDLSLAKDSMKKSPSVAKLMDNLAKHRQEEQNSNDGDVEVSFPARKN